VCVCVGGWVCVKHVIYIDSKVICYTILLLLTKVSYSSRQRSNRAAFFQGQSSRFHKFKNFTVKSSKRYAMPTGKQLTTFRQV
jgi:hypothetical protein